MKALTLEQQCILTGFTGLNLCGSYSSFLTDVSLRLGRSVFSHELGDEDFAKKVKELYTDDFMRMMQLTVEQTK